MGKQESKIVDLFTHRGRVCVIVLMSAPRPSILWRQDSYQATPYHNGYVSVMSVNHGVKDNKLRSKIKTCGLTYSGDLNLFWDNTNLWFIGFDTTHVWNYKKPETQTYEYVKKVTIKLANEMIRKGI